ncbi:Hypp1348 [Branchiostoma lanceolatum]|uniref:Hypp1348 protein n=1 Tax=Branchiostoma lanceolatum TaxID=7740 RepID=A0A8K0EMR2_BRALA|nr:Hypp1348 [Branchiostoma lanceolatum]
MEKCQRISDAAFDDLQKQFVDITDSYNKLRDEWVMKEREREKSHTAMLKDLSTKAEAAQRSLEGHIKKVVTKLQNDLRHAQKDLVLQREELAKERGATVQEMMIERNLWKERNHNLSIKIDDLTASNAKLQHAITTQDAEIEVLVNRLKDLEERDGSFTYIKHRKLNQDRSLYHPDQIHLDHRSGTKLLVSDVKRTLNPASGPGAGRQSPDGTGSQTNRPLVNQRVPKRLQPGPSQAMNPPPHQPYTMKPTPRNTSGGTGQVAIPTLVKDGSNGHPSLHISTPRNTSPVGAGQVSLWKAGKTGHPGQQWKQLGSRLRKVWNILMS